MATGQYDDAWETKGWTAQNFAYPPDDTEEPDVILPSVTLSGDFQGITGNDAHGLVTATPSKRMTVFEGTRVFLPRLSERIRGGKVSFDIPIGDWDWDVRQRIGSQTITSTLLAADLQDGATVDLATI